MCFVPIAFAVQVRRACKGLGTDENLLIDILCCRTKSQVEKIDQVRNCFSVTIAAVRLIELAQGGRAHECSDPRPEAYQSELAVNLQGMLDAKPNDAMAAWSALVPQLECYSAVCQSRAS